MLSQRFTADEYRKIVFRFVERQFHLHRRPPDILVAPNRLDVFGSELRSTSENAYHPDQQKWLPCIVHDFPPQVKIDSSGNAIPPKIHFGRKRKNL
jgi:hypothetical protein